jgi:hypothetical protein
MLELVSPAGVLLLPESQRLFRIQKPKEMDQLGYQAGPPRLVAGAQPGSVVPVEALAEQKVVAPVGGVLGLLRSPKGGTAASLPRACRRQDIAGGLGLVQPVLERQRPAK